jgi:hypothetical protein
MKITLDYAELNSIIKCYINETLGLTTISDANIVCSESDYEQNITADILVAYESCNDEDDD